MHYATILLVILSASVSAQTHFEPYKLNDRSVLYMDTVLHLDISKKAFFQRSKIWIAKAFDDGREVTIHDDQESGTIVGKGFAKVKGDALDLLGGAEKTVGCTINIICKDGRARLVLDQIMYEVTGQGAVDAGPQPIERYYWKRGEPANKERMGLIKLKDQISDSCSIFLESWSEEIANNHDSYSDF